MGMGALTQSIVRASVVITFPCAKIGLANNLPTRTDIAATATAISLEEI
jgi:hypothetical protein